MRCNFCYATFQDVKRTILPKGHLSKVDSLKVVQALADFGFQKITFAGGEPTLCKWLPELISVAKKAGMTTMIVSNGSRLTDAFIEEVNGKLDWISISVDSLSPETNVKSGRAIPGKGTLTDEYLCELVTRINIYGFGLKINTVVNQTNFSEDMTDFIRIADPKRWKVMQVLPIKGQNDGKIEKLTISEFEFQSFIQRHIEFESIMVPERNEEIKGSYVMVDPAGRFFCNSDGSHTYSKPILEVGVNSAIQEMLYDQGKFIKRGGIYDWKR